MTESTLQVAAIQPVIREDRDENMAMLIELAREAAEAGAQLVVLPELHNTPYFCQSENPDNFDLAEPIPGPTTDQIGELAEELDIVIVASIFEDRGNGVYHNTAVALDRDGQIAGIYRKMHIPDDPGFYEKYYFTPGDLGFYPIPTSLGKLGVLVCWDQWFPEAARLMTMAGAEILIYPTAIGWDVNDNEAEQDRQYDAWQTVQRGHAVANHMPVIACNRTGFEADSSGQGPGIDFWGGSFICGPQGEILAEAEPRESIIYAEFDLSKTRHLRRTWPFFRDRRIDQYDDLMEYSTDTVD